MGERKEGRIRIFAKYRRPSGKWRIVTIGFPVVTIAVAVIHLFYYAPFGILLTGLSYILILMAAFLPLNYLWIPFNKKAPRDRIPWYDIVLAVLAAGIPFYIVSHQIEIFLGGWEVKAPLVPFVLGTILILFVLEAARRSGGPILFLVVLGFAVYPIWSVYCPIDMFWGPSMSFRELISGQVYSELGLMGNIMSLFGELVMGFMAFAVAIQGVGAGDFFNELAQAIVGKTRGGNAKVAIVASAFFASISGAGAPNVLTTGAFTIPAMKKEGLPAHFAGGVEAAASSGGTITPPVMGAAAFLMAEFVGISYAAVCIAAAIPAALYFLCLFSQIDAYAARIKLMPPPVTVKVPPIWKTILRNYHIVIGIGSLVAILFLYRMASQAPWMATAIALVLAMSQKRSRIYFGDFLRLLESIGRTLCDLMPILASVGLIVGALTFTGVALSLPHEIVSASGGNMYLLLFIGAVTALILGMGVTTSAIYIFLAIVLAPALVDFGFNIVAVHLFIIFCGAWSHITPPVALAAYTAASVAEADFIKTCFAAMKLGVAKYLLPFVFVLSPALILQQGTALEILQVIISTALGLSIIGGALEGYFWYLGGIRLLIRALFFTAGFLLVMPGMTTNLYGIGLAIIVFILVKIMKRTGSPIAKLLVSS